VCDAQQHPSELLRLQTVEALIGRKGYAEYAAEPTAEADRGRHSGFPHFNVIASGPGSLAERSAGKGGNRGSGQQL